MTSSLLSHAVRVRNPLAALAFVCLVGAAGPAARTPVAALEADALVVGQTGAKPAPRPAPPAQPDASRSDLEVLGEAQAAEAEEELQQLIAQAEVLAGVESPASAEAIALIGDELEALQAGLMLKASLLEEGQDTTNVDLEIASRANSLRVVIDSVTEQDSYQEPVQIQSGADQGALPARISSFAGEVLSVLSKIQEFRVARRAEEADAEFDASDDLAPAEEILQEVSGVVTASGEPVEGVSVTDPESGITAVTDADGHYTLQGLPPGRWASLILAKGGKRVGEGQLDLAAGRDAVADFDLATSADPSRPLLKVTPSAVVVAAPAKAQNAGSLKGRVHDAGGKPVVRALVTLGHLARARTDSKGQYRFLNVPAGTHELKVFKPGLPVTSERVRVAAGRINEAVLSLPPPSDRKSHETKAIVRKGSGARMSGAVTSVAGQPLAAAKVTLIRSGRAVSVRSGARGTFLFSDLEAGQYRVLVSKAGYHSVATTVSLNPGASRTRNYQLKSTAAPVRAAASKAETAGAPAPVRTGAIAAGRVVGRITDAATGKPVPGALVILHGHTPVETRAAGSYSIAQVAPGPHRVVVKTKGFASAERKIDVVAGGVTLLDVALTPDPPARASTPAPIRTAGVLLAGRVLDRKTGRPVAGAVVSAGRLSVKTDPTGRFTLPNLARGTHRIVIRADGYQQASETVTIGAKDQTAATFTLVRNAPVRRQ